MPVNRNFKIVWVAENYGIGVNSPVVCDTTVHYKGDKVVIPYLISGMTKVSFNNDNFKVTVNNNDKTTKISYVSTEKANAEISFIDLTGRCLINKSVNAESGDNMYIVSMDKYGIAAGVYIVSLKSGNKLFTGKIAVQ